MTSNWSNQLGLGEGCRGEQGPTLVHQLLDTVLGTLGHEGDDFWINLNEPILSPRELVPQQVKKRVEILTRRSADSASEAW